MNPKDWIEAFHKVSPLLLLTVVGVCFAVLFLPQDLSAKLGMLNFCNEYRPYLVFALIVSAVILLCQIGKGLWGWASQQKAMAVHKRHLRKALETLSGAEWCLLLEGFDKHQKTVMREIGNSGAQALINKGIVSEARGQGKIFTWPYTINDYVWNYLQTHPELISRGRAIVERDPPTDF